MDQNNMDAALPTEAHWLARGRSEGLATAALATGLVSFINLLGVEKGLLALVLGLLALKGSIAPKVRQRAKIAVGLALLQFATIAFIIYHFYTHFYQLVRLMKQLG
jgi:hypothetical protein